MLLLYLPSTKLSGYCQNSTCILHFESLAVLHCCFLSVKVKLWTLAVTLFTWLVISSALQSVACRLWHRGCQNRAHCVSWLEVVKGIPNQGLVFFVLTRVGFYVCTVLYVLFVCGVLFLCSWLSVRYQCSRLSENTRLLSDLSCVIGC